ncbi:MAG: hypothetical protein ACHQM6_06355 [Candidatus Kapaibacterium sp.]
MQKINDITVKEALDRLSLPAFYTDDERMIAYYVIMESGNLVDKVIAEKIVGVYPLEEFSGVHMQEA